MNLKQLYDTDYESWLLETIKLINNHQLDQLDQEHLVEELENLGNEQKRAVESLLEQIIKHLLMCQFWIEEIANNKNHWEAEIVSFRSQIQRRLTTNLRNHLQTELPAIYQTALLSIQRKTKLNSLPPECPYSLEQLLLLDWFPLPYDSTFS